MFALQPPRCVLNTMNRDTSQAPNLVLVPQASTVLEQFDYSWDEVAGPESLTSFEAPENRFDQLQARRACYAPEDAAQGPGSPAAPPFRIVQFVSSLAGSGVESQRDREKW